MTPEQLKQHLDAIAEHDADVDRGLRQVGYPQPRNRPEGFETLVATIVSQQLSTQAAASIMKRLHALIPSMDAGSMLQISSADLRHAGLSARKVEYAQGLARAIEQGEFLPHSLRELDESEALQAITRLRGFGTWSAQIYLMFSLGREDIFPADDLALQVALQRLRGLQKRPTAGQAHELIRHWSPWRSAGSLFLWHYYRGAPT